ncbi:phage head-tail joining protein [Caenimonas terrae]|uniref:Phage head-tail joining protein n=1 Tax=Caenimonas terrae TaxID=696074 RepID=A0ABW0NFT6_9BURK
MSFTSADLAVLDRAIAASELTVEIAGRKVTFDNFDGLKKRRDFVAAQLAEASRPTGSFRYRFTTARGD